MTGVGYVIRIRILRMISQLMEQVFIHSTNSPFSFFFPTSFQTGVLAIHLHQLRIEKPFTQWTNAHQQEVSIDTFRLCISVYALSRYSKTVRVYSTENTARFDQTMHMLIRVEEITCLIPEKFFSLFLDL